MMFRIGVDVGGTYTDLVATDESGRTIFAKSPSTPADQSIGVMAGLEELARRLNVTRAKMLALTDRLVHGTTVATNALLERKGAKVALLTTEGHRDVIEMREGLKPDRYDLRSPPPEPLVPRELRFGIRERLKANGEVLIPLDAASLDDAIAGIKKSGATSVAVCFLHSYLNPVHELAAVERLKLNVSPAVAFAPANLVVRTSIEPDALAATVFQKVTSNSYGIYDGLIISLDAALGRQGRATLRGLLLQQRQQYLTQDKLATIAAGRYDFTLSCLSLALRDSPIDHLLGLKNNIAFLREMAIGIIIIVFLVFEPDGLAHRWRRIKAYWKLYPFSH